MNRRETLKALAAGVVSLFGNPGPDGNPVPRRGLSSPSAKPRLQGGFIEYRNSMMNFGGHWGADANRQWTPYPIDWPAVLDSMRQLGMTTVIIKRMAVRQIEEGIPKIYSFYEAGHNAGPTDDILAYADANGMEVFIGLVDDPEFGFGDLNEAYLIGRAAGAAPHEDASVLGRNQRIAAEVWPLIKHHRSFTGWYIPNEIWNFSGASGAGPLLNCFFALMTRYLREGMVRNDANGATRACAATRQIAISPYFNRDYEHNRSELSSPDEVRTLYDTILTGAGIDVVMVQDSYAVAGYDAEFVNAFADAARGAGLHFWMNVENFSGGCPADFARLSKQLEVASAHNPERLVTFDFFHYMNPVVPDCCPQPGLPPKHCMDVTAAACRDAYGFPAVEAPRLMRQRLYDEYSASL